MTLLRQQPTAAEWAYVVVLSTLGYSVDCPTVLIYMDWSSPSHVWSYHATITSSPDTGSPHAYLRIFSTPG